MNHEQKTAGNGLGRRQFLRNSVLLTVPLMAGGAMAGTLMRTGGALRATQLVYEPPVRSRGTTLVDVKSFRAHGDGIFDDTNAIQAAINSLPSTGGTVFVPAGTYLIDAVKSINLRSLMHFQMDPEAVLVVKTNTSDRYLALLADVVHDVEISGGRIIGDRDTHVGTTGEGGHGIKIRGASRVTIATSTSPRAGATASRSVRSRSTRSISSTPRTSWSRTSSAPRTAATAWRSPT